MRQANTVKQNLLCGHVPSSNGLQTVWKASFGKLASNCRGMLVHKSTRVQTACKLAAELAPCDAATCFLRVWTSQWLHVLCPAALPAAVLFQARAQCCSIRLLCVASACSAVLLLLAPVAAASLTWLPAHCRQDQII